MKRLSLTIMFAAGLLVGMFLSLPVTQAAWPSCRFPYTVQPGDTLSGIAARAGVNIWELARANQLRNMHYIYAGQVLCLPWPLTNPTPDPPDETDLPVMSSLDLVVQYTFVSTLEAQSKDIVLSRDNRAGLRLSYPLASGNVISTYAGTQKVRGTSSAMGSPLLWIARTTKDSNSYVLVAIGDPSPILDLQMGVTRTITEILPKLSSLTSREPVTAALKDSSKIAISLQAELIGVDGSFVPINIEAIDYKPNVRIASQIYEFPGFALHPSVDQDPNSYWLLMVLNEGQIGPPGFGWASRCGSWGGGGWWSGWMRSWYGCSGYRFTGYRYPRYRSYRPGF